LYKEILYNISFPDRQVHYCEVGIILTDPIESESIFYMPVWTPGSYLIREFSKNTEDIKAVSSDGEELFTEKINKNSWRVFNPDKKNINFSYRVYCNELTVRTSRINSDHAFLSPAGIFMTVEGMESVKCIVKLDLPDEWKEISTGLKNISENIYYADNYDILIDSPLEIGNHNILEFEIQGVKHFISLTGSGNYDGVKLIHDFKKIAEEQINFFGGEIPYEHYTFIIHLVENGGGGLEHRNSFVVQMVRLNFCDKKLYNKFLGLVSHEFFHLWNVKRIRPAELGPFNYNEENYTKGLWVAEGWTSFYDNVFLRRCGLINDEEYFEFLGHEYNDIMRYSGRHHQSLTDSSFDTWIKFYRKDENYNNSQISYYTKGALVAMMLDLEIIRNTNAERSLDDVMRILFDDYKKDNTKGFTQERVKEICEFVSGINFDDFWKKYVNGKDEIPMEEYISLAGLEVEDIADTASSFLGIESLTQEGRLIISKVFTGGSAYISGLNFKDEIISIDSYRADEKIAKNILSGKKPGDVIKVMISRDGIVKEINVMLAKPFQLFKIKRMEAISSDQERIFYKWING